MYSTNKENQWPLGPGQFSACEVVHLGFRLWIFFLFCQSYCTCAPGYFRVDLLSIFRVIALDIVKFCNYQVVSHEAQNVFKLGSWNFTGRLISMCSCAPGYFRVDLLSILELLPLT
jgi:hypothetical protein